MRRAQEHSLFVWTFVGLLGGIALGLPACSCGGTSSPEKAARPPAPYALPQEIPHIQAKPNAFLKGQLHAHTNASGDSDTPPEQAALWYARRDFDFVVFTDHNRISDTPSPPGLLVLKGVELTQNLRTCDPPPSFLHSCLLHVNALFVRNSLDEKQTALPQAPLSRRRLELFQYGVDTAKALGGIAQLNHPNFHLAADAEILEALAKQGLLLVEIANQAEDSNNEGDDEHPSTEAIWDRVLSRGIRVFGTATDDAHHYDDAQQVRERGEIAYTGDRGFVMVRAEKSEASIRAAVLAGDFYASTGVLLDKMEISPASIALEVRGGKAHRISVIGQGGVLIQENDGQSLRYDPSSAPPGYVRVRICEKNDEERCAWTQPYFTSPSH